MERAKIKEINQAIENNQQTILAAMTEKLRQRGLDDVDIAGFTFAPKQLGEHAGRLCCEMTEALGNNNIEGMEIRSITLAPTRSKSRGGLIQPPIGIDEPILREGLEEVTALFGWCLCCTAATGDLINCRICRCPDRSPPSTRVERYLTSDQ